MEYMHSELAEIRNPARAAAQRHAGGFLIKPGTGTRARWGAGAGRFLTPALPKALVLSNYSPEGEAFIYALPLRAVRQSTGSWREESAVGAIGTNYERD